MLLKILKNMLLFQTETSWATAAKSQLISPFTVSGDDAVVRTQSSRKWKKNGFVLSKAQRKESAMVFSCRPPAVKDEDVRWFLHRLDPNYTNSKGMCTYRM